MVLQSALLFWSDWDGSLGILHSCGIGSKRLAVKSAPFPALLIFLVGCSGSLRQQTATTPIQPSQPPAPAAPTATLSASPSTITAGQSTTLSWQSANAGAITLDGNSVAASGTEAVYPSETTTYQLNVSGLGGTAQATATVTVNPAPPLIVFMGDSITAWWGNYFDFPAQNWINAGIPGQKCSDMLARFDTDVIAQKPVAVHVLCGTNDIWQENGGYLPITEQAIQGMIDKAKAANISVIIGTVPPVSGVVTTPWNSNELDNAQINALDNWIKTLGLPVADYHTALELPDGTMNPAYTIDGIHPNADGYAVMLNVLKPVLPH